MNVSLPRHIAAELLEFLNSPSGKATDRCRLAEELVSAMQSSVWVFRPVGCEGAYEVGAEGSTVIFQARGSSISFLHRLCCEEGRAHPLSAISATTAANARNKLKKAAAQVGEHDPQVGQLLYNGIKVSEAGGCVWERPWGFARPITR